MLGERLKTAIRAKNLTQRDFAEMAGVTEPTVSRWIRGDRGEFGTLKAICDTLDVSADWLLGINLTRKPIKDAADLDAIRRACNDYLHDRASSKDTLIKIIQVAINGERG